jgi:alpha-glucosidase
VSRSMEIVAVADGVFRIGRSARSPALVDPSASLGSLETAAGRAEVGSEAVSFFDGSGLVASFDGFTKRRPPGERYFGCGERTSGLEKTGSHQVFWNVDPPMGHTASFNNLYTSIPFVLCLHEGRAHGVFYDHPGRVEIDLAKADPDRVVFEGADDPVLYVFLGPTPADVLDRYTALTGRTPMPPLWALGNQQSRWSYMDADEVREVAAGFRARGIPCDVLYLDIDHMDGYRVFTWDGERFPDPAGLISELRADGFRVVTITDPGVKVDESYPLYVDGRSSGFFCLTRDGDEFQNVVWPGLCAFPDFTDPAARDWWGSWHRGLVDAGVAGVWCDMNEPALFVPRQSTMPEDVVHPGGGRARLHADVHNAYGSYMAQAAREGLARLRPGSRPFVISRAGYAGLQRHALQWTGDNSSWWEHLWMSMPQLQNLGLSGIAWAGVDVGGFFGDCDGELLARWTEFGAFQPFCRNHSAMGTARQEPWAFGEPWEGVCRDMLQLRMRLVPYLYTLFEECHRTGAPVLRALLFSYPDDPTTYTADDQFMLGDALLVAPITRPGVEHRHVYLPAGFWRHFWTDELIEGPAHVLAHAPLGQPALYVRSNMPIPLWPVLQHTGEVPDSLTWRVFVGPGSGCGSLYEDSGDGYGPGYSRTAHVERGDGGVVRFSLSARSGSFVPAARRVFVDLGGDVVEVEESAEAVVIERVVTNDD